MRKVLSTIVLASASFALTGCDLMQTKNNDKGDAETETSIVAGESLEDIELTKLELPCSKEVLYAAWKQIGTIEVTKRKNLDYKQNTPALFFATDLNNDGATEVLLRGESPYAAIFTYANDSLQLVTFVNSPQVGLSIAANGTILRSGTAGDGSFVTQFICLNDSTKYARGEAHEKFVIQDNEVVSSGTKYWLQTDSAMVEVSKEVYLKAAPHQEGIYLEDIDGWEDFRKP